MKKSIAYLPKEKQEDLRYLMKLILDRLPETEFIILYGSYARNEYVDRDVRDDDGFPTVKISDYDMLVVTSGITDKKAGGILDNIDHIYFKNKDIDSHTPVQFINDDIKTFTKAIGEGRYFYTEIKEEGVMLYNSGKYKMPRKRKLNYTEIKQQAGEYFEEKFESANEFLLGAKFYYEQNIYKKASFLLHQACENYYYAIRLTFTLQNNKQHNLSKLSESVESYSNELLRVFPCHNAEEKRLFDLLKASYVDARYKKSFRVTQEDIFALIPKVELLRDITKKICEERIEKYGGMK